MSRKPLLSFVSILCLSAFAEVVEIRSAADWAKFANRVNEGELTLNAVMREDVTLAESSPLCGKNPDRRYCGKFDGNGKTLTVAINVPAGSGDCPAAPFQYFGSSCEIHDLHVAGTITTARRYAGGILGHISYPGFFTGYGKAYVRRCRVSATIKSAVNGEAAIGGFIGSAHTSYPDVYLEDCVFNGKIIAESGASQIGGFLGRRDKSYLTLTRCLFAPAEISVPAAGAHTLVWTDFGGGGGVTDTFYTKPMGEPQGTDATSMGAAELCAILGGNWRTVTENGELKTVAIFRKSRVDDIPDPNSGMLAFAYQGALRDAQGHALVEKRHTIEFRVYSQATGGAPHWGRKHQVVLDEEGNFSVEISDVAGSEIEGVTGIGLAGVLARNEGVHCYLGLSVDGGSVEISPRQRLLAVPAASYAADAMKASSDMGVTGDVSAHGAKATGTVTAKAFNLAKGMTSGALTTSGQTSIDGNLSVGGAVSGYGTIPIGGIIPWHGQKSDVPKGWAVCNGETRNGVKTPDLSSRFIVGASSKYVIGSVGGKESHKLSVGELPKHSHSYGFKGADIALVWENNNNIYNQSDRYGGNTNTKSTNTAGEGEGHENRPPYYALLYIMRVE